MKEYHKIQTVFLRDPATKHKTLLEGQYALPEFAYLAQNRWFFTEKVDGTNIRVMFDGEQISFGGKTDAAEMPAPLLQRLQARFASAEQFADAFRGASNVCLYGEGYGAGIQKAGRMYGAEQDFVLFDVKVGDWWLHREDVEDVAAKLALPVAPVLGEGTLPEMVELTRAGFASRWNPQLVAEGIVARPVVEMCTRKGERLITKVKHKDFDRRK